MSEATLEHANVTTADPAKTAEQLCRIFGWRVRWEGEAKNNGYAVHVGSEGSYVALYRPGEAVSSNPTDSYTTRGGLNHLGVVVSDLDAVEAKVVAAGYKPYSHADYAPGRRFYFRDSDQLEIEVVSYQN